MLPIWSFRDVSAYSDTEQQSPITERRTREIVTIRDARCEPVSIDRDAQDTLVPPKHGGEVAFRSSCALKWFVVLCWWNRAALKRRNWFRMRARGGMDVWPAECHKVQCKNTPGLLTIRLLPLRYFSTSYKLCTETLALGIIIRCLRAVRRPGASSLDGPEKLASYALSRFHVEARFHTPLRSFSHTRRKKHVKRTDAGARRLRSTRKKCARNSASLCVCTATGWRRGLSGLFKKREQLKKGSSRHYWETWKTQH